MNFLLRNKTALLQIILLLSVFYLSVAIRAFNFNQPLGRHHEWITAHTLMTLRVWEQGGGPEHFHFSPVYTYDAPGNKHIGALGGVEDAKGDFYYVSYPDFAFLLPYYTFKITGCPVDESSMQLFGLLIHLIIAISFFLLVGEIMQKKVLSEFCLPAWIAFICYLFASGNLWFHQNVYFVDVLMQLFLVWQLYLFVYLYNRKGMVSRTAKIVFALLMFLAVWTEWLGLMLLFVFFIFVCWQWLIKKQKQYFQFAWITALVTMLSLGITFWQYSSVNGATAFIETSLQKYNLRSGMQGEEGSEYGFSLSNPDSYEYLKGHYDKNYLPVINLVTWISLLWMALMVWRRRTGFLASFPFVLLVAVSGVLLHLIVFFNFNVVHDFSTLKGGFIMMLWIVLLVAAILELTRDYRWFHYGIVLSVTALVVFKMFQSYDRYVEHNNLSQLDYYNWNVGSAIRQYAQDDEVVYVNGMIAPECMYYAGRNYQNKPSVKISAEDLTLMHTIEKGIFFRVEDKTVVEIYRFDTAGDSIRVFP